MEARLATPFGHVLIQQRDGAAAGLHLDAASATTRVPAGFPRRVLDPVRAYLSGEVTRPDVPLHEQGSPFERAIWHELANVTPGQPITYGEMARRVGRPLAARAVGQALRKNPLPLVWPCHRVVASTGIGGFGGHTEAECREHLAIKRWLLAHEARMVGAPMQRALMLKA